MDTTTTTESQNVLSSLSNGMADAVAHVNPALVLVNGRRRLPASGIVYETDMIITADHVLEREEDLTIQTHDGRVLSATFVARDRSTDIAILRVDGLNLTPAQASDMPARVGQFVLAVGRPSGNGPMASVGIVSTVGSTLRTWRGPVMEQYIQTDATPYPGFSGGPLVDVQGHVVGMTTTGLVRGVTLAVPAHIAWRIAATLANQGHMKRGYLGIASQAVQLSVSQREAAAQEHGLLVVRVEKDSPAEHAGMLVGDIVLRIKGQVVTSSDDLQAILRGNVVDTVIEVAVLRGETVQTLHVTVEQRQ